MFNNKYYLVQVSSYPIGLFKRKKNAVGFAQEESKRDNTPRVVFSIGGKVFRRGSKIKEDVKAYSEVTPSGAIRYSWEPITEEDQSKRERNEYLESAFLQWVETLARGAIGEGEKKE